MKDYDLGQALEIIKNITPDKLKYTEHFNIRNFQRVNNMDEIINSMLSHNPVGLIKQDYNSFKVIYQFKKSRDLYESMIMKR